MSTRVDTRLVTATCSSGHLNGWQVEQDARGIDMRPCSTCSIPVDVDLGRTERAIRPTTTPQQREQWAIERARAARLLLEALVVSVEEYVRLQDLTISELPPASPLRRAVHAALLELRKTCP